METGNRKDASASRLSSVRRDIVYVNEKIDSINDKLDSMRTGLNPIPSKIQDVEKEMAAREEQLENLVYKNRVHSAKLDLMRRELEYVKLENDMLLGKMQGNSPRGYQEMGRYPAGNEADTNNGQNMQGRAPSVQSKGGQDDNKQDVNIGQAEQSWNNRTVSKNNTKHANSYKKSVKGDDSDEENNKFDLEEQKREERRQKYGFHDSTAINPQLWEKPIPKGKRYPWMDGKSHPSPGGFVFMRYDDAGFNIANIALKGMQSICRHAGGYLLGTARKERITVHENAPSKQMNWKVAKEQPYQDVLMTENCITVFWFTRKDGAEQFLESTHNNRFREPGFPTANGYEAFYVPLLEVPPTKPYNTFLFVEFLDARRYRAENMTQFEAEVRNDMLRIIPDCRPMVISSQTGRVVFKPGVFVSPYSKLYVSRFKSPREADHIWNTGMIEGLRMRHGMAGPINVFSFTIDEAY